jgi:hypothetical protein
MCGEANRHLAEAEVAFLNVQFLFARSAQNERIGREVVFSTTFFVSEVPDNSRRSFVSRQKCFPLAQAA